MFWCVYLLITINFAFSVVAMHEWSDNAFQKLKDGLSQTIAHGEQSEPENNGVLTVCKALLEQLKTKKPHQLQVAAKAQQLLDESWHDKKCAILYNYALVLTMDAYEDRQQDTQACHYAWLDFKEAAENLIAKKVEEQSSLRFNAKKDNEADLYKNNYHLISTSNDAQVLQAAILALYGLTDIKQHAFNSVKDTQKVAEERKQ